MIYQLRVHVVDPSLNPGSCFRFQFAATSDERAMDLTYNFFKKHKLPSCCVAISLISLCGQFYWDFFPGKDHV